jgi:hypothetical protein
MRRVRFASKTDRESPEQASRREVERVYNETQAVSAWLWRGDFYSGVRKPCAASPGAGSERCAKPKLRSPRASELERSF